MSMFNKKNSKIWIIIGILLFIVVIYLLVKHLDLISNLLLKAGPWAPLIALILYPLLAATPIITDPVTIIIAVIYGPMKGALIAGIGNTIAAMVEYYIGLKFMEISKIKNKKEKMPFGLGKLPVNSLLFLIFGRMIPGYGSKIISLLAAIYKVPIKRYIWTSALTSFLGAFFMAYGGFSLIKLIRF